MLMALTSVSRVSPIYYLDNRFMLRTSHEYISTFYKLHKSWRKGASPSGLLFHEYPANKQLCVVKAVNAYLSRGKSWHDESKSQLLLSFY